MTTWHDKSNEEKLKDIRSILSDMAFKSSMLQEHMHEAQLKYWRRLEIDLRRAFLERFRYPMKLARGEFIRYCNKEHDITIYSYEGRPFAVEKQVIVADSDGNTFKGAVAYRVDTVTDDIPISTLLKNHIPLLPEQPTFDAMQYWARNSLVHLR